MVPPEGFLSGLRTLCDRFGLLLILNEIFCGFGRTGTWFACEAKNVVQTSWSCPRVSAAAFP